jgi:serine/threonine protein kinase
MDYCAMGSVADLINTADDKPLKLKNIKEDQIAYILSAVVGGVVYLHAQGIFHR